jgi:hypothetical protein
MKEICCVLAECSKCFHCDRHAVVCVADCLILASLTWLGVSRYSSRSSDSSIQVASCQRVWTRYIQGLNCGGLAETQPPLMWAPTSEMSLTTSEISHSTSQNSSLTINHSPIIPLGSSSLYDYISLDKNYVGYCGFCVHVWDASVMRWSTGNIGKQTVSRPRSGSSESSIANFHQADDNLCSFRSIGWRSIAATSQWYSAPNVRHVARVVMLCACCRCEKDRFVRKPTLNVGLATWMEKRCCDLPIISDSQTCNCTGTLLWHKVLVLELNNELKRTYGHLLY